MTGGAEASWFNAAFGEAVVAGGAGEALRLVDEASDVVVRAGGAGDGGAGSLRAVVASWASDGVCEAAVHVPRSDLLESQVAEEAFGARAASGHVGVVCHRVAASGAILRSSRSGGAVLVRGANVGGRSGGILAGGAVPTSGAGTGRGGQVGASAVEAGTASGALRFIPQASLVVEGSRRAGNGGKSAGGAVAASGAQGARDTVGRSCTLGAGDAEVALGAIGERRHETGERAAASEGACGTASDGGVAIVVGEGSNRARVLSAGAGTLQAVMAWDAGHGKSSVEGEGAVETGGARGTDGTSEDGGGRAGSARNGGGQTREAVVSDGAQIRRRSCGVLSSGAVVAGLAIRVGSGEIRQCASLASSAREAGGVTGTTCGGVVRARLASERRGRARRAVVASGADFAHDAICGSGDGGVTLAPVASRARHFGRI